MTTTVKFDEPIGKYHSDREHFGSTTLKTFDECRVLLAMHRERLDQEEENFNGALMLGTHWHQIREVGWDRWRQEFCFDVPPEMITAGGAISTSKRAQEWLNDIAEDLNTKRPLTPKTRGDLNRMEEMFHRNTAAVELENDARHREPSIRWRQGDVGLRVRPDLITESGRLVDYKTTSEPDPLKTFRFSVRKYRYGLSDVLYERGCEVAGLASGSMTFVVTSTVPPFGTQVITLDDEYREFWKTRMYEIIDELGEILTRGELNSKILTPRGYGVEHKIKV